MRISNMCEYMRWRYTIDGFIQWRDVARYAKCWWLLLPKARGGCIKLGKVSGLWVRVTRNARINYSINELIIVLYKN